MKRIIITENAGFCFGVRRAMDMVESALKQDKRPVYCLGKLIHNDQVVQKLEQKGLITIKNASQAPKGSLLVIRSHGAGPQIIEEAKKNGVEILDATCPFVKKVQQSARSLVAGGYQVVICGDAEHAEVIGINGHIDFKGIIISDVKRLEKKHLSSMVGVVSQTTQKIELFKKVINWLVDSGVRDVKALNTICFDTAKKQAQVRQIIPRADALVVVGGRSSSNTTKLAQIGQASGVATFHVESSWELQKDDFIKFNTIAVAAGASTAQFLIDEVVDKLRSF